jgi:hypothetical protein
MNANAKARVEAATVRLVNLQGQGVLVPGGFILTAAHCVKWDRAADWQKRRALVELIETRDGRRFLADVCAADLVADIAALATADNEEMPADAKAFDLFAESVEGVPIATCPPESGDDVPVWVLTHNGAWITGTLTQRGGPDSPLPVLWLCPDGDIECGTSGGPVVDGAGGLLGIVSRFGVLIVSGEEHRHGSAPMPWLALPRWLADSIVAAQEPPAGTS